VPTRSVLEGAAARAPATPGVYVFLGSRGDLLYIGKARSVRRRLADHARNGTRARVRDVRWADCADEAEALCLEADLVVALSPPYNATMAGDTYEYISMARDDGGVTVTLGPPRGRYVYGGFAQLGKGKVSWAAVRCKAGYSGLLRLLWVTHAAGKPFPSRLHGNSPPVEHRFPIYDASTASLRELLSGRSRRLLASFDAAIASAPAFMRRQLRRDAERAEQFYWLGPCRVRRLRLRHGLRSPVDEDAFRDAVARDLREAIGDFTA
jgi:hypothetical protein